MIITIVGARPQFIKAAMLSAAFKKAGIKEIIVHTGQHYDYKMSQVFFDELNIPATDINLNIGSGSHAAQTAEMLIGIEKILLEKAEEVNYVLLYGDTNSTLAGALAASKLNIKVIHVEAGLRSFNKTMPEEVNRIVTDHLSDLLFCSSSEGFEQLANEGINKNVYIVGDIMLDALTYYSAVAEKEISLTEILPENIIDNYLLLTIHRPGNTNNFNVQEILESLAEINSAVVWPVHPRYKSKIEGIKIPSNVFIFQPFSYLQMLVVLKNCKKVVTDSGGLQKEAYWSKKPCITIRPETEWVETLHNNWNILAEPTKTSITEAINMEVDSLTWMKLYGDGKASDKIITVIQTIIN